MKVRVIRSHDCRCGFRNEFDVGTVEHTDPNPPVDLDELEVCPGAGCKQLVAVGTVFRIAADPLEGEQLAAMAA